MTLIQILSHLNILNAEVALCRNTYRYTDASGRWACSITLEHEQSELKFRASASDGDLALVAAYEKLKAVIDAPVVAAAFALPALAAPVSTETPATVPSYDD